MKSRMSSLYQLRNRGTQGAGKTLTAHQHHERPNSREAVLREQLSLLSSSKGRTQVGSPTEGRTKSHLTQYIAKLNIKAKHNITDAHTTSSRNSSYDTRTYPIKSMLILRNCFKAWIKFTTLAQVLSRFNLFVVRLLQVEEQIGSLEPPSMPRNYQDCKIATSHRASARPNPGLESERPPTMHLSNTRSQQHTATIGQSRS
jgi:hypothetical protein